MVKSRYLCSAPRPETWDERAEALLKSLGGSPTKIEAILRETLDSLRVMHSDKQKTGPGRKSNAEHAIAFYEYVLETITENKEEEGEDSKPVATLKNGKTEDAKAGGEGEEAPVKRKRGRPRKNKIVEEPPKKKAATEAEVVVDTSNTPLSTAAKAAAKKKSSNGKDGDNSVSIESMDTEEFINQHNDLCEVCSKGGELLMCSTCNLVFHQHCVRPKLEEEPDDSWVCAYCIMSSTASQKPNSKLRKSAAVAVRLMARMRKSLQRQRQRESAAALNTSADSQDSSDSDDDGDDDAAKSKTAKDNNQAEEKKQGTDSDDDNNKEAKSDAETEAEPKDSKEEEEVKKEKGEDSKEGEEKVADSKEEKEGTSDETKPTADAPKAEDGKAPTADDKQDDKMEVDAKEAASKDEATEKKENGDKQSDEKASEASSGEKTPPRKNTTKEAVDTDASEGGRRIRRNRKKATYYDPQNVPASKWKTDGANEWKYLGTPDPEATTGTASDDEVDDDDDAEGKETTGQSTEGADNGNNGEGQGTPNIHVSQKKSLKPGVPWCNFCNDDKSIPVCCFCACRVCFGKHDQSNLLLCDRCDDEYHIFCLDPPLKSVPSSGWFCPTCLAAEKNITPKVGTRGSKTPSSSKPRSSERKKSPVSILSPNPKKEGDVDGAPPAKRGPGRPRKHPLPEPVETTEPAARKRGRPPKNQTPSPPVEETPRKRGRPRKHPLPEPSESPPKKKKPSPEVVVKRGPGRPPSKSKETETVKRGPGRPPSKSPSSKTEVVVKRGPGRPPSKSPKSAEVKRGPGRPPSKSPSSSSTEATPKRGPGRPRKNFSGKKSKPKSPSSPKKAVEVKVKVEAPPPTPKVSAAKSSSPKARAKAPSSPATVKKEKKPAASASDQDKPTPVKVSRSGRKVKRTAFHDEIDEGEQHLKSIRYAELQQKAAAASAKAIVAEHNRQVELMHGAASGGANLVDIHGVGAHSAHDLAAHGVDVQFLDTMPDVADMSHLVGLEDNFIVPGVHDHMGLHDPHMGVHMDVHHPVHALEPPAPAPPAPAPPAPAPYIHPVFQEEEKPAAITTTFAPEVVQHVETPVEIAAAMAAAAAPTDLPVPNPLAVQAMEAAAAPPAVVPTHEALVEVKTAPVVAEPVPAPPQAPPAPAPAPAALPPVQQVTAPPPVAEQKPPAGLPPTTTPPQQLAVPAPPVAEAPPVAAAAPLNAAAPVPAPTNLKPAPAPSPVTDQAASAQAQPTVKVPRRKPGARECLQISRRFGVDVISDKSMETLLDYCKRGKVEHLIRMRERLDEHSRHLELQVAGLEALVQERGELDAVVPAMPDAENS